MEYRTAIFLVFASAQCLVVYPGTIAENYYNSTFSSANQASRLSRLLSWMEWSTWSSCSATCGGQGVQVRTKGCRHRTTNFKVCNGREVTETRPCGNVQCRKDIKCETAGTVVDSYNIPLSDVEISLDSGNMLSLLTRTNEDGFFSFEGICSDSMFARLVAQKNNYVTTSVYLNKNESGIATSRVKLMNAVKPLIYQQPTSKSRLIGKNVKFCCKARGSAKDHYYTWYHNGTLIDASFYSRDPSVLEIRNINHNDAGSFLCKVESLTSLNKQTSKSDVAVLKVYDSEKSSCDESPLTNFVALPDNCKIDGVKVKKTGKVLYIDVGDCSRDICPSHGTDQVEQCGQSGESTSCCGPSQRDEVFADCGDFVLPVQRITKCQCQKCVTPIIKVRGRVFGTDPEQPLRYGYVERAGQRVAVTSYDGHFSVDVPFGIKRLVLTFIDRFGKLLTTTKILTFKEKGGITFHEIKLLKKSPEKVFDSSEKFIAELGGTTAQNSVAHIVTSPKGYFGKDGRPYTGKVRASVTFIDTRDTSNYEQSPNVLSFINSSGDSVPLQTFGMFEMDFRDDEYNELNVAKAKVVLDQNEMSSSAQAAKLKLWSLNPENGMWEEEDNFGETEIFDDEAKPRSSRRKREVQTFFVGNLEIRERRMYNLDVPVENRCWMKVRAYRSPDFDPERQVEGVEVTAINMEPDGGFRGNPNAWGRYDTSLTSKKEGACVRVFCHDDKPDAYKAIVTAKLDGSEELYAASSKFPIDPNVVGIRGEVLKRLQYNRSDHSLATGKKSSFQTNLPKPTTNQRQTGPIYPDENFCECMKAPVTDNHFRFFRTEDFLYEYNTVYMDEHDCLTWTPHYLNWWPKPLEYTACYIKVHISGLKSTVVRAKNFGGTHPETIGKLYGIRDDKSVTEQSTLNSYHPSAYQSAACLEFKCSGQLYDMEKPDRTLVTVIPQGDCTLQRLSGALTHYLTDHPPAVEGQTASEFRMYAPTEKLGHNFGIYTVTEDDPVEAKKLALGRCYAGSSDSTSRIMETRKGVAIYYHCRETGIDIEQP